MLPLWLDLFQLEGAAQQETVLSRWSIGGCIVMTLPSSSQSVVVGRAFPVLVEPLPIVHFTGAQETTSDGC